MTKEINLNTSELRFVKENCYKWMEPYLRMLDACSRTIYQSMYIIDYDKMSFMYVSDNPLFLCGYTSKEVKEMGFDFYSLCIPERERELLPEANKVVCAFFDGMPENERILYTVSCDFHLLHHKKEILINHKQSPVFLSKDGKIRLAVCSVSLSAFSDAGHLEVRKKGSGEVWRYCRESDKWRIFPDVQLTEREHSILALSAQGLTIRDMSERLYITEVTVKHHRTRLFEKLEVGNITEVLFMAINDRKL